MPQPLSTLADQRLLYRKLHSEWLSTDAALESVSPANGLPSLGQAA